MLILPAEKILDIKSIATIFIVIAIIFSAIFISSADALSSPQNIGAEALCTPAVNIFWKEPNGQVQSYKIENIGIWPPVNTTDTGYTDIAVSRDTYYIYDVTAIYSQGESAPSSILLKTPNDDDCAALDTNDIEHNCPYTSDIANDKYALSFYNGKDSGILRSHQKGLTVSQQMPAGKYRVRLVGLDGYPERITKYQPNEQYYVSFKNSKGTEIAKTSNTTDLKDYVVYDYKDEVTNSLLTIPDCVNSAQAMWGGGWNMNYAGSLSPVCGYFEKLDSGGNLCQVNQNNNNNNNLVSIIFFTATPNTIGKGSSSNLEWTTTNAISCTASGGWSGSKSVFGSESVGPLNTTSYILSCKDSNNNTATKGVVVTVNQLETISSVNCQASPQTVNIGQDVTWEVFPVPSSDSYTYSWSGDDTLSGSSQSVTKSYSTIGTKKASVSVSIDGASNSQQCTATVKVGANSYIDEF